MTRIDTHQHLIPPDYRKALHKAGIDEAGGRSLPDWSPDAALQTMAELDVATGIVSVSTPGTAFLPDAADAAGLARDLNDYRAALVGNNPDRFGFFATIPTPHIQESVAEVVRALDELSADGVVLLANSAGTYLGQEGQDDLFAALDARSAVVFIHPADLPGPTVPGVLPFRRRLPARYHPSRLSAGAQWNPAQIPEHQVHPQPRGWIRAVRVAPDGGVDHGRYRAQPGR